MTSGGTEPRHSRDTVPVSKGHDSVEPPAEIFIFGPVHLVDDPASLIVVGEC